MSDLSPILASADATQRIQDDLFRAVNGAWLESYEIPADLARAGAFITLRLLSEERVHEIIESLAAGSAGPSTSDAAKIGALFASWMNTDARDALGIAPLRRDLAAIEAATTRDDLAVAMGTLLPTGVSSFFRAWVGTDINDPTRYVTYIAQSGLGLPNEAYYREPQHADVLAAYREFVPRFLSLVGLNEATAPAILAIETALAATHMTVVEARDATRRNNPMSAEDFAGSMPAYPWASVARAAGAPADLMDVNVHSPQTIRESADVWEATPLDDLKAYCSWRVALARAPFLSTEVDAAYFDFYGRVLAGTHEQRALWKRGVSVVESVLGEAVGREYVARHFPAEYKEIMLSLVGDLLEAYRRSITTLDWMGEDTKKRALEKLATFTPKIGYPDSWRDYSSLPMGTDLVENITAAARWEWEEDLAKLGTPVDRREWLMTPQTVNAYYYPVWNEIVFPAAILQFPFFDPTRDAALNYGAIGAVIGHEIGHGFDDQGSKYAADGSLNNWWTDADRAAFEERTAALVAQYDAFVPADLQPDGPHVIGSLTLGENIGDLGGLSIAIAAYGIALEREGLTFETAPVIDGYTGLQRVFLSWARVWQSKYRPEAARQAIATDPHSPAEFRVNGVVRNVDAFAEAFGVTEGDALYLSPDERVRIW